MKEHIDHNYQARSEIGHNGNPTDIQVFLVANRHSSLLGSELFQVAGDAAPRPKMAITHAYRPRAATCSRSPAETQVRLVANLIKVAGDGVPQPKMAITHAYLPRSLCAGGVQPTLKSAW